MTALRRSSEREQPQSQDRFKPNGELFGLTAVSDGLRAEHRYFGTTKANHFAYWA
jgi:hypothetical protein